jgi:transposase
MKRYEKAMRLSDEDFKQVIGVRKPTYEEMLAELRTAYAEKHRRRGRHSKLSLEDILFMALAYWRQYITQKELAFEFEIGEATVHDWIVWVEDTLVKSKKFSLPGKKALLEDTKIEVVLVDVTESPIERPKKNKKSGTLVKRSVTPRKHS